MLYFTAETMFTYTTDNYTNSNGLLGIIFITLAQKTYKFNNSGITKSSAFCHTF